ncbi:DUF3558 domain-containing protein [Amycolatopsis thermophila]|uniref:DUF3558 domain-containing protein n=1 Tax=Amycolatopsis thermophila TaxID=206084 RepID=A0ABU0EPN4_9PSEU|nr:DUF3558 domain-containing protein [Amycolatopsis thermophila]MDQ0377247.1 hypothetical protein [Amycolatopsis thermophila]
MSKRLTAVAFVCAAIAATGCTSTVSGTPAPAMSGTPTSADAGDPFAGMVACRVLDQLNAGQGFNPGDNISRRNECTATKPGLGSDGLALDPVQGLAAFKQINPESIDIRVNGRKALQEQNPLGCTIAFEVSDHARVLAQMAMSQPERNAEACPLAHDLAERVEALLPRR